MDEKLLKDFSTVISSLLSDFDDNEYYKELFGSNTEMLELLFDNYFRKVEGFSCSHDKSVHTVNTILKALKDNKVYPLSETYDINKYPQMKEYEGEVAYWCPATIKDTQEAIEIAEAVLTLNFRFVDEKEEKEKGTRFERGLT